MGIFGIDLKYFSIMMLFLCLLYKKEKKGCI
jgi:hypothetical protein